MTDYEVLAMAHKIYVLYLGFQARPPALAVFWILCLTKSWSVLSSLLSPMLARYLHRSLALLSLGERVLVLIVSLFLIANIRDLFLVYAGLYIRYMSVVPPFTWAKYFDPTLPTATIQPTTIRWLIFKRRAHF